MGFIIFIVGIIFLLNLTPEHITDDLMKLVFPNQSLRDKVRIAQGKKKSRKISAVLREIKSALTATGKDKQFTIICMTSFVLFICGILFSIIISNYYLMPILAIGFAIVPFLYVKTTIEYYDKHIKEEMETALSIITTSYKRNNDITKAITENLEYLKPPIADIFKSFIVDTALNCDIKSALKKLCKKIDNQIFKEWVDTLIQCQDDRTLNDSLFPIVNKLTEVRIVNNELRTMLYEPKKEYYLMVAMVIGNIPLLYMLNKDWFYTLMNTTPGKIVLALCGVTILVTSLLMNKYTKPIEYRK